MLRDHDALGGVAFGATLMAILTCHELGHYIVARRHGVDVSLPYFIPLPPMISLGTLGAVIRMSKPIDDRNALFDVGAAGPIAGLVVAIPLLVIGLSISQRRPGRRPTATSRATRSSTRCSSTSCSARWLPGDGVDVQLHPMAFAAWVGLLVTMINLMPIGQLDGGHVARAAFGQTPREVVAARLHVALPIVGCRRRGRDVRRWRARAGYDVVAALVYAKYGAIPWLVWTLMLAVIRAQRRRVPPAGRRRAARSRCAGSSRSAMLVVFLLIATPVPFRPVL